MFRENCRGVFFTVFVFTFLYRFRCRCLIVSVNSYTIVVVVHRFRTPRCSPTKTVKKTPWSFSWNTEGHTDALVLAIVGMAHYELGTVCTLEGVAPHEICSKCEHC